jgi:hypothetical protein
MGDNRRNFLGRLAAGAAVAAGGIGPGASRAEAQDPIKPVSDKFDMSWVDRVHGRFRGVFDSPKVEEGGELFRAAIWPDQVAETYGVKDDEITAVLVIRHVGIPLIMNDEFWSRHELGKANKMKDPATGKHYQQNPIRSLEGKKDVPPLMAGAALEPFMQRGGIVLACNFAFEFMVALERTVDKDNAKDARARALRHIVPGIILQPSGFFGLLEAQRAGCHLFAAGE